ncbi:poly-U binding splicing factor, half-pint family [Dictyocaulus viviparus]|uniref:Poly-U binding splicing factor, half-pint family n=1 Tax=Dictyocaulus viviparus TaxID=29172 RepID=A0A0D8YCJ5_DICVI|nr:poly-U binding splicing factor, half-pint family [Dictyocaulus viviparus]
MANMEIDNVTSSHLSSNAFGVIHNIKVFVGPGSKREAQLLGLGLTKLSSRRKDDLQLAKRYAMDVSIKQIMLRQQKAHHENQQKQAMYAQALSLMARVYIGSISFEVREEMIKKAFEVYGPIKSINMSWDPTTGHHKGFAFLEFDVPEAALLAQESMNGQLMGGRNLKVVWGLLEVISDMSLIRQPLFKCHFQQVGRPSNMPQAQPIIEMVQQDAKKYHRVYVSSVHPDLSENDLKSVFEAFGEVVKCQLARQCATGKGSHRGFGYIEFNNAAAMNEAIAGMNMFDLGGQFLRVGRCITPPEALTYLSPQTQTALPTAAAQAAAAVTAKVMAAEASGGGKTSQASGSNSPRPMSPASVIPPAIPVSKITSVASPVVISQSVTPPSLAVPPPPIAVAKPQLYNLPSTTQAAPVSYVPQDYGIPPPPMNGFAPVAPPMQIPPVPPPVAHRGFGGFVHPPTPVSGIPPPAVPPPPQIPPMMAPPPPPTSHPPVPPPKVERTFEEKMERILERTKAKQEAKLSLPATFGALDPLYAPKDPLATSEGSDEMLAITGKSNQDVQSMALALIGDNALAIKGQKNAGHGGDQSEPQKKKKRVVEAKKIQPKTYREKLLKLNTAQALAAAAKAGELSDAVINEQMNSEDATLASQEGLAIRGNDARHLLMAKLMRTNRSTVLVLRNMVNPEDIDEYLEEEIKEECSKYGDVQEVVIANDQNAGIVKIFVRFIDPKQVDAARAALDKRFFGGNTVSAEVYDQAMFDHNDLSG